MFIYPNPLNEFTLLSDKKKKVLTAKYSESFRTYHNIEHISKMWQYYWWHTRNHSWTERMKIAIVFHDAVFIPGNHMNEIESATYMCDQMGVVGSGDGVFGEIYRAIIATSDHTNPMYDDYPDWIKMFLDLDLYELGSSKEIYNENGWKVLDEFKKGSPVILSHEALMTNRKLWLEKMLASKKIFRHFTDREKQARLNIENNLRIIKNEI